MVRTDAVGQIHGANILLANLDQYLDTGFFDILMGFLDALRVDFETQSL
jgi:hypothetical protein